MRTQVLALSGEELIDRVLSQALVEISPPICAVPLRPSGFIAPALMFRIVASNVPPPKS